MNPGRNPCFLCVLRVLGENRESGSKSVFSMRFTLFFLLLVTPPLTDLFRSFFFFENLKDFISVDRDRCHVAPEGDFGVQNFFLSRSKI